VRVFLGVHPSEAKRDLDLQELERLTASADGIGEIGLDPKYSGISGRSAQMDIFTRQLELAERLEKPVQVHSRNAEKACLAALAAYRLPRVLLHWFEGGDLAKLTAGRGYYVSFGPTLLYSRRLERIVSSYPPDLLLTESDAPVKYPPLGASISGPLLVPSIVFALARLKGLQFEEMQRKIIDNSRRYLIETGKG